MFDILVSLVAGFIVSTLMLKRISKPWIVYIVALVLGVLIGWQVVTMFPSAQTSLGYLLSTNPELSILWQQTHDIHQLAKVAPYAQYYLMLFNGLAALTGCFLAAMVHKRATKNT